MFILEWYTLTLMVSLLGVSLVIFCSFCSVLAQDQESCVPQLVLSSNMIGDFEIYLTDIPLVGELATV